MELTRCTWQEESVSPALSGLPLGPSGVPRKRELLSPHFWGMHPWPYFSLLWYKLIVCKSNCCCSVTKSHPTLCDPTDTAHQASLSSIISWSLLRFMSTESVMPSNHLILCHPLLPPSIFPSIRLFSNESVLCIRWPKYWNFSFSISPSNEYSGLISFKID